MTAPAAPPTFDARPVLGALLIGAALLVGVGGLLHPILTGDAAAQLAAIRATRGWHAIHLTIAFGFVLAVAGLAGTFGGRDGGPGRAAAGAGVGLAILGYGISIVTVLFMDGAAGAMAAAHGGGATAEVTLLYDVLHPFARGALRVGALAVSLALVALGWSARGAGWPAWIAWLGLGGGAAGAAVALALPPDAPAIVAGLGVATAWQLAIGVWLVRRSRAAPRETGARQRARDRGAGRSGPDLVTGAA